MKKMECVIVDDEPSSIRVIENYIEKLNFIKLMKTFNSPIDLINSDLLTKIDLIFLDINMPDMNGLDFLRSVSNPPFVILTTAYRDYAAESYTYDVVDYLHKPFSFERFLSAIEKIERRVKNPKFNDLNEKSKEFFLIKVDKIYKRINFEDVLVIESMSDYAKITTYTENIVVYKSLKEIIQKLPCHFSRIHKSFIINTNKIVSIEENTVFLENNYYPIGQSYKSEFLKKNQFINNLIIKMKVSIFIFAVLSTLSLTCNKANQENDKIDILDFVWSSINTKFYDSNFNNVNWRNEYQIIKPIVSACRNDDSLFFLLNQMLFKLNSSHCGIGLISDFSNVASPYLFGKGDIGIDIRIIENQIVITKVKKNSIAEINNLKQGYIIEKINGLSLSEIQEQVINKPPFNKRNNKFHLTSEVLRHIYGEPNTAIKIDVINNNKQLQSHVLVREKRRNGIDLGSGLPEAYIESYSCFITDSIAYLTFNAFKPENINHILNNLKRVMNSKGLIIDLRGNDGGSIEGMKSLLGKFISKKMKYGTYINRYEKNEDFIIPTANKYNGEVVLLVDEMSISAAENMAGIFQLFDIGIVIGSQTPGQLLWGAGYMIHDSIVLTIPIYKLEYINGFNVENNGIAPNIKIDLTQESLLKGIDLQLEAAKEYFKNKK
jgi:C-terminal processing protease CtpA/Prc/DNA-binding LytR/AlgR family response regulator